MLEVKLLSVNSRVFSGSMQSNAAESPTAASYGSRGPPGQRGSPRPFLAERRTARKEVKRNNAGRSTPEFRWFPVTLFLSSRWKAGGPASRCLKSRRAGCGGRTLLPAPLWCWEAGRGVAVRAAGSLGPAGSRDRRGLWGGRPR